MTFAVFDDTAADIAAIAIKRELNKFHPTRPHRKVRLFSSKGRFSRVSGEPPRAIFASTFTRKAAGEMKARFFEALRHVEGQLAGLAEQARSAGDAETAALYEEELARTRQALGTIEHVFIDTIHAFCARLLRERPLEAGLVPGFATVEDRDDTIDVTPEKP